MTTIDRKTYNVPEVAQILGISRPAAYTLAASASFPSIRVSERRIVVPCEAFERWLENATKSPNQ